MFYEEAYFLLFCHDTPPRYTRLAQLGSYILVLRQGGSPKPWFVASLCLCGLLGPHQWPSPKSRTEPRMMRRTILQQELIKRGLDQQLTSLDPREGMSNVCLGHGVCVGLLCTTGLKHMLDTRSIHHKT